MVNRSIFQTCIIFIIFSINCGVVSCMPQTPFMLNDKLNNSFYFYCGNVQQTLLQSDLHLFLNNFDQVSFELVKYLKNNNLYNLHFVKADPREHHNLILDLKDHSLNYYYSFPFSHNSSNPYYECLHKKDWYGRDLNQY